jgi:hypothetical protein
MIRGIPEKETIKNLKQLLYFDHIQHKTLNQHRAMQLAQHQSFIHAMRIVDHFSFASTVEISTSFALYFTFYLIKQSM